MAFVAGIRSRVAQFWRNLSTATKQLATLAALAALLVVGFFVPVSAVIARTMRASVDADLRHNIGTLHTILTWEGYYLQAESHTVAGLEGVGKALQTGDVDRLRGDAATFQHTHALDAIYILTGNGEVLISSAPQGPDPAIVAGLDLVRDGLAGQSRSGFFVAGGRLWFAGVAPHVGSGERIDAAVVLAMELDREYLRGVSTTLGNHIVLTDGQLVTSSLAADEYADLLTTGSLRDSLTINEPRLQDVRLGGAPYRLLLAPLGFGGPPALVVGVLQDTSLIESAIRHIIARVVLLGVLFAGLAFALVRSHTRSVFRPLRSLVKAAEVIAAGELDQPLQIKGAADVEALAASLDQMRIRLKRNLEEQRRWNEALDAQVRLRTEELEQLCRVRDQLVVKLISAQEDERQRVARELHDETSQALVNLVVVLGTVARLNGEGEVRQYLEQARSLAIDTLEGVKRIILDLRPRLLDDYGLLPAIRWYAEERLSQVGVEVVVEVTGTEMRLPSHTETAIFRVIQEAVNNIARHGYASQARIGLTWASDQLTVKIEDNGRGFDVQEVMSGTKRNGSLGLLGMQERVSLVDGTLSIDSAPGSGTRILIQVPLPEEVETDVYIQD